MAKLVECIPNFSEGKSTEVIDKIVSAITSISGIKLTDRQMNADHNRAVITFVGSPEACKQAAFNGCKQAMELIDLRTHKGEHPRMGATDVIPFVPISDVTMEECIELSRSLAKEIAEKLNIPTYLYEESAVIPERRNLAIIRKGEFEGLRESIKTDPARKPDFGLSELHPSAGATVVGARQYLIAYNINLDTNNLDIAKEIAKKIRFKDGGFPAVKALGFEIKERGIVQVSINLTDYTKTGMFTVFDAVVKEAQKHGVSVTGSEVVGVLPLQAIVNVANLSLKLEDFSIEQVLEKKMWGGAMEKEVSLNGFISELSSNSPAPGGGSASALSGSIGAALVSMVAELTIGKEKYKEVETEMVNVRDRAKILKDKFMVFIKEDEEAFNKVMAGYKLPKNTEEEKQVRSNAIQLALQEAAKVPLEVMKSAKDAIELAAICASKGNTNSISDAGVAAIELKTAGRGAMYNVLINLGSIKDDAFKNRVKSEAEELFKTISELAIEVDKIVLSKV